MVVNGNRQDLFGLVLADHVVVQGLLDFVRSRQVVARLVGPFIELFADDVVAQLDTLIADKNRRAGDQFPDFMLALAAKGTIQQFTFVFAACFVAHAPSSV